MFKFNWFVHLILIFGPNDSTYALGFLPVSSLQVRENRLFDAEFESTERSLHVHLKSAKLFIKHVVLSIKHVLKKLRTAYRFLKPEMKMGSCLTHYYNINLFGLRRRRRRALTGLRLTPTVADKLLSISDSLSEIQQALADIIHELHRSIPNAEENVIGPAPNQVLKINETRASFSNSVTKPAGLLERVDLPLNSRESLHANVIRHFPTRVIMFLLKKSPEEAVELWKSAKNRTFWGWVKLIVGKIIKNKLLICSREYMGTRLWDWVDYGLRKI